MTDSTLTVVPLDARFNIEMLGYLPHFLAATDPRPAKEQFAEKYIGGWQPMHGFDIDGDTISFDGDPPLKPLCVMIYRDEWIYLYPYDWVRIGSEISRMD